MTAVSEAGSSWAGGSGARLLGRRSRVGGNLGRGLGRRRPIQRQFETELRGGSRLGGEDLGLGRGCGCRLGSRRGLGSGLLVDHGLRLGRRATGSGSST